MIRVSLEFASAEEMLAYFNARVVPVSAKAMDVTDVTPKSPKPTAAKAAKPAATQPVSETATATPASEPVAPEPVADSHSEQVPSYEEVAAVVIKCSKLKGRPFVVDLLKPFGLTALTGAKPEQYASIKAVFDAVEFEETTV